MVYSKRIGVHGVSANLTSPPPYPSPTLPRAGCVPAGPCCKYPGDPKGSCPSPLLHACETSGRVVGCTHHHAHRAALEDPSIPTITMLREVRLRLSWDIAVLQLL